MIRFLSLFALILLSCGLYGQNLPLGQWVAHLPYSSAISVAESGNRIFCGTDVSVFSVNKEDGAVMKFSTANGLSEIGLGTIAFDPVSATLVIAYSNSNIDLVRPSGIINMPDILNKQIVGDKSVKNIFTTANTAWLATGFGIVKLDLMNEEVDDSYFIGPGGANLRINDIWADESAVFAATEDGVRMGKLDGTNLSNFSNWKVFSLADGIPQADISAITGLDGVVYASTGNVIYAYDGTDWTPFFSEAGWETVHLSSSAGNIYFIQYRYQGNEVLDKRIGFFGPGIPVAFLPSNFYIERPRSVWEDTEGKIWIADEFRGLSSFDGSNFANFIPNGPYRTSVNEMAYMNGSVWVASAPIDRILTPVGSQSGIYRSVNHFWENYNLFNNSGLTDLRDISIVEPLPAENKVLFGTNGYGIFEFNVADGSVQRIDLLGDGTALNYRISGMESDRYGNVWIVNAFSGKSQIICRRPGGAYIGYDVQDLSSRQINGIVVDEFDQLWISIFEGGIYVYDYNRTVEDPGDDNPQNNGRPLSFNTGEGTGGLPTNQVTCMEVDQDGEIWIGTGEGISVVFCPGAVFSRRCDAERICIPRSDTSQFCDNLLEDEFINSILVDEADRKWIGTNNGLFLQSSNGFETIHYYTEDNSPLLSDQIRSLAINPENGDVFIGTEEGIISYRGEATVTQEDSEGVYVFPNPVREDFTGDIAIRNLPNNATVKITDAAGFLAHETRALGGQALWDGRLLSGKRAATGVYFVFASGPDGKEKTVAKFVLISNNP